MDGFKKDKPIVLVFVGFYKPGYKAGGPIRSITNLVDHLHDEYAFRIVTSNRDLKDVYPYADILSDDWNSMHKEKIFYMSSEKMSIQSFSKILNATRYDIVYLNSFFSPQFTIKPLLLRRFRLIPHKPFVLAPRGEFSPGALKFKFLKKRIYMWVTRLFGLYSDITWHASSNYEKDDIQRVFGINVPVIVAPNLPPMIYSSDSVDSHRKDKKVGELKMIFVSRISRKKNLIGALKMLEGLNGNVCLDIYGPIEDKKYWENCREMIGSLNKNIVVNYSGSIPNKHVASTLRGYHLFYFPTHGENFGHVILEALCAGCPVLISDQTPWRDLEEKGIGWDLPLSNPDLFHKVLQRCVDMNNKEYLRVSQKAREYGTNVLRDDKAVLQNKQLFQCAAGLKK